MFQMQAAMARMRWAMRVNTPAGGGLLDRLW